MAFLCPSRLGRNKQKRGYQSMMRRLTESEKFDTLMLEDLVKLSWTTPDSRRIILQNFTSCDPQEITVKQGQKVNYIYREGDWAFVVTDDRKEGFVPFICLAKIGVPSKPASKIIDTGTYTKKPSVVNPRNFSVESEETDHSGSDLADDSFTSAEWPTDSGSVITIQEQPSVNYLPTEPFDKLPMFYEVFLDERTNILHKNPLPSPDTLNETENSDFSDGIGRPSCSVQFKVMHNFAGHDVYDIPVQVGETVHLLDDTDPGWFWVRKNDGTEGYVPSNYITEITDTSKEYIHLGDNEQIGNNHNHHGNIKPHDTHKDAKTNTNVIPVMWKVTNDLTGKNPAKQTKDTPEEDNKKKKQRPKKPPRKKKNALDDLSLRMDESFDSIDTCISMSSTDCLESQAMSSCDELSPRSNAYSDSSVFESSFNGVYNYRQFLTTYSDTESSPRSVNLGSYDNDDVTSSMVPNSMVIGCEASIEDRKKIDSGMNDKLVEGNSMSTKYQPEEMSKSKRDSRQSKTDTKMAKAHSVHHPQNYNRSEPYGREVPIKHDESFESKCSRGQKKRPVSMTSFTSYHEYKKDYFDEYFYNDNDTKFANKPKQDVVNVAEILKMRKTKEHRKHSQSNEKHGAHVKQNDEHAGDRKVLSAAEHPTQQTLSKQSDKERKENQSPHHKPKLKQFLMDLPSTNTENKRESNSIKHHSCVDDDELASAAIKQLMRKRYSSKSEMRKKNSVKHRDEFHTHDTKKHVDNKNSFDHIKSDKRRITSKERQYNSSTDLREMDAEVVERKNYNVKNQSIKMSENKENENTRPRKTNLRPYNSSTDLREIRGKPDWSFGYPRRTRQSIGRKDNDKGDKKNASKRSTKSTDKRKGNWDYRTDETTCTQNIQNWKDDIENTVDVARNKWEMYDSDGESVDKCIGEVNSENTSTAFDDCAMMDLLRQTGNLLHKTDKLLHKGGDKRHRNGPSEQKVTNQRHHNSDWSGNTDRLKDTSVQCLEKDHLHPSMEMVDINSDEKCYQFLNNSTIGIHGMTYTITKDHPSVDKFAINTSQKKNNDSQIMESESISDRNESRREKSNIIKDSRTISEGLKSLDLQDIRGITEFVCQCDCDTDTDDKLPIKHGEIVHIGLDGQENGNCYWAFSPRLRKYGFVSKQHVKIPLVTII